MGQRDAGGDRPPADRRQVRVLSAGPDHSFGTKDDFLVAEFQGAYFASTESRMMPIVNAVRDFPRTTDAFRSLLSSAGVDFDALRDPWGRAYYVEFRSEQSLADRVRIYSYAEYNRGAEERRAIVPVKRTILIAEIRSVGEDGLRDTYDDFTLAHFSHALDELASMPEEVKKSPRRPPRRQRTISGVVFDPSGAVVVGVEVTLNRVYVTRTDERGSYYFRGLAPGMYRLGFESPGFRLSITDHVPVQPDRLTRVDAVLEVGSVSETIEVTAPIQSYPPRAPRWQS